MSACSADSGNRGAPDVFEIVAKAQTKYQFRSAALAEHMRSQKKVKRLARSHNTIAVHVKKQIDKVNASAIRSRDVIDIKARRALKS